MIIQAQSDERCIVRNDSTHSKPQRGEMCIVRIEPYASILENVWVIVNTSKGS